MTNLQAALGVAQLENINRSVQKKRWIGSLYNKFLKDVDGIYRPVHKTAYCENIYWVYSIVLAKDVIQNAKDVMKSLRSLNIGTRPFFFPMHQQPVFKKMGYFSDVNLKNSEYLYQKGFYLPSGLALTEEEIYISSQALIKCMNDL